MLMATAKDTADYFIWLAAHECPEDPVYLTPLQLQKLLYFAQGWSFAEFGTPLFRDAIEAWKNGPVVPTEYDRYKRREGLPIMPDSEAAPDALSDVHKAHIRSVWDAYKRYSAWGLRDLTHAEEPYQKTYQPDDREGRCRRRIDTALISKAFESRCDEALSRLGAKRNRLRALAEANTRALTGRPII